MPIQRVGGHQFSPFAFFAEDENVDGKCKQTFTNWVDVKKLDIIQLEIGQYATDSRDCNRIVGFRNSQLFLEFSAVSGILGCFRNSRLFPEFSVVSGILGCVWGVGP